MVFFALVERYAMSCAGRFGIQDKFWEVGVLRKASKKVSISAPEWVNQILTARRNMNRCAKKS